MVCMCVLLKNQLPIIVYVYESTNYVCDSRELLACVNNEYLNPSSAL